MDAPTIRDFVSRPSFHTARAAFEAVGKAVHDGARLHAAWRRAHQHADAFDGDPEDLERRVLAHLRAALPPPQ